VKRPERKWVSEKKKSKVMGKRRDRNEI